MSESLAPKPVLENVLVFCKVAGICGGCSEIQTPYPQQLANKEGHFRRLWAEAQLPSGALDALNIMSLGEFGLRDRVEMTLHRVGETMRFGLYDLERKEIVDLKSCPQMTQAMKPWFDQFRANLPNLELGAARLRVSPSGEKGLWLHFPNVEIERFLKEAWWLSLWRDQVHVEMGQRRRTVVWNENGPTLGEPQLKPWFQTWTGPEMTPQELLCSVGSFTQPGFKANHALVQEIVQVMAQTSASDWLELGSGIGNFTLPLAAGSKQVVAVENDKRAISGLMQSAEKAGLNHRIQVEVINLHGESGRLIPHIEAAEAVLADPPRSGLGRCLESFEFLEKRQRPQWFFYISCFAKTMVQDLARLHHLGYEVVSIKGLDQFPQSRHCEWLALLKLK